MRLTTEENASQLLTEVSAEQCSTAVPRIVFERLRFWTMLSDTLARGLDLVGQQLVRTRRKRCPLEFLDDAVVAWEGGTWP